MWLRQDKPQQAWQLNTGTGGTDKHTPASQAALTAPEVSASSMAAQSDTQIEAIAVPAVNQATQALDTAVPGNILVKNSSSGTKAVADVAQVTGSLSRSAQPTISPAPNGTTSSQIRVDSPHGLASCEEQLAAFNTMCGSSNHQKLRGFLQSIFQYQEVSSCGSIVRANVTIISRSQL